MSDRAARILEAAKSFHGIPYRMVPPPDGVNTLDCSLYVLKTFEKAGYPFPSGIRTAEQIRQVCEPVEWSDVEPSDLLLFEHTYEPNEPPGPDGLVASHIGISLGAGSKAMWNAVDPDGVKVSNVGSAYWQSHLMEARRFAPAVMPPPSPGTGVFVVTGTGTSGLRVRATPDTSAAILGTLPEGTRVSGEGHAWRRVQGNGLDGWSADEYLEPFEASEAPRGEPWAYWSSDDIANACNVPKGNVETHWPRIYAALAERGIDDQLVQAAAIGTVAIETASTFQPVREAFWLDEDWRRRNLTRYYPYYGRGHIQLTWESNYSDCGNDLGVDLVSDPDRALDAEISARVLALFFDQHGVADAAREPDWGEVRRRVQGGHVGLDRLVAIVRALGVA